MSQSSGTNTQFTFVGLPFQGDSDLQRASQFQKLQASLGPLGPVLRSVMIPQLRVGTLDSLVEASDDLARLDPSLETTVFRLIALIEDIAGSDMNRSDATMLQLSSQKISADHYLKDFEAFGWHTSQFDTKDGIGALVQKFQQVLTTSEERCRGLLNEYNEARNKLGNFGRRTQGYLNTIPINEVVDAWCKREGLASGPVDTEFLTTIFVAVPLDQREQFQENYAHFHDFVVPRSASLVSADSEYALFAFNCFKKVVDDVKAKCRHLRYAIRDTKSSDDLSPEALFKLKEKVKNDKGRLIVILAQQYTQCFVAWIHLKCVRLFVESVLKYGVPVRFIPALIAADPQKEEEVLQALERLYKNFVPPQLAQTAITDETTAIKNAKLVSFTGGDMNATLQTDGAFVILKTSNVLRIR
jgi:V-type H+-transporting ATPase subunit C